MKIRFFTVILIFICSCGYYKQYKRKDGERYCKRMSRELVPVGLLLCQDEQGQNTGRTGCCTEPVRSDATGTGNNLQLKFLLIFLFFSNCSIFQFSRHSDFADWYIGKAGFYQTLQIPDLKKGKCFGDNEEYNYVIIAEDRHPLFLHFRTPEIFWNPQGSIYYPSTFNYCGILKRGRIPSKYKKVPLGRNTESRSFNYLGGEAGLLDSLIPYKVITSENMDMDNKMQFVYLSPILFFFNFLGKLFVFPVYMSHDIIKIPVIPAAVIYYSIPSEKEPLNEIQKEASSQKDSIEKDNKVRDKYKGLLPEEAEEMRIRDGEKN